MIGYDAAPIAAIATAPGRGGIGVIRVSGPNLEPYILRLLKQPLVARNAHYLSFVDQQGQLIDKGLAIFFKSPHSYTGEDVLELQGHGGTAVMQALLDNVLSYGHELGLRLAEPGEFSLRAYLNDKIDLVQAEAIADLVNASSIQAAQAAALSLSGTFSSEIDGLVAELVGLRTLVEATLDFPEEEIEFIEKYQISRRIDSLIDKFELLLRTTKQSVYLSEGLRIVLAGEPNVGKSSLMNAIFGEKISIVTDIAGTTRDSIKDSLQLDGVPITVTDTAGLRPTDDLIEQMGIDRSWAAIETSNIVLDVVDARSPKSVLTDFAGGTSLANKHIIQVCNKSDLLPSDYRYVVSEDKIYVSAHTGQGLETLKQHILKLTGRQLGERSPWLARKRHVLAIEQALSHLILAKAFASENDTVLDLLAEELRLCHQQLGSIVGTMSADDLLGEIFTSFCIGK